MVSDCASCSRVRGAEDVQKVGGGYLSESPAQMRGQGPCAFRSCVLLASFVLAGVGERGEGGEGGASVACRRGLR